MRNRPRSASEVFAALGDETRLRIVSRLSAEGPLSITRLAEGSPVTRQGITKHLRVMERAGLARCTRRGRESLWQLEEQRIVEARRHLDAISRQWESALERLRVFVEE